jgi:hypothetical protein
MHILAVGMYSLYLTTVFSPNIHNLSRVPYSRRLHFVDDEHQRLLQALDTIFRVSSTTQLDRLRMLPASSLRSVASGIHACRLPDFPKSMSDIQLIHSESSFRERSIQFTHSKF